MLARVTRVVGIARVIGLMGLQAISANQRRAQQDRTGQGRTGQAGQGRAGHGRAGQGRAGQGRAGQTGKRYPPRSG